MDVRDDVLFALDPVAFARGLQYNLDTWQRQAVECSAKQILLNCSRQLGKSRVAGIKGLHRAVYTSGSFIVILAPALRQSSELFGAMRSMMLTLREEPSAVTINVSETLDRDERVDRLEEAKASLKALSNALAVNITTTTKQTELSMALLNGSRVVVVPANQKNIRGFSNVSLLIEDEAAQIPDEAYMAVLPMLGRSGGQLLLLSSPYGKRGHFYDAWSRPDKPGDTEFDRWVRFTAKAIDYPERIAPEVLRGMREKMGDLFFRQEYGGEFLATVNQVFSEEDILRAFTPTVRPLVPEINAAAAAEKPPTQEQLMVMAAAGVSAPGIAALTTVPWPRGW